MLTSPDKTRKENILIYQLINEKINERWEKEREGPDHAEVKATAQENTCREGRDNMYNEGTCREKRPRADNITVTCIDVDVTMTGPNVDVTMMGPDVGVAVIGPDVDDTVIDPDVRVTMSSVYPTLWCVQPTHDKVLWSLNTG